jgi:hypothetical protein
MSESTSAHSNSRATGEPASCQSWSSYRTGYNISAALLSLLVFIAGFAAPSSQSLAGKPDVLSLLEQKVEVEGDYQALYEDYEDGSHKVRHFLQANGKRTELDFTGKPPLLSSGTRIRVQGVQTDKAISVDSGGDSVLTLAAGGGTDGGSNGGTPAALANTFGEQRTLVLMANFQENPDEEPLTVAQARALVFGEISDFFYENSYQQTWLAGDVYGWFTLPLSNAVCEMNSAGDAADQAAIDAGIDLSAYTRIVYLFTNTACNVAGAATVGGTPSRTWIDGVFTADNLSHEMGHNFGLYHSHALDCYAETLGTNCNSIEYGDSYDVMGNPDFGHFNAFQKARLGWLGTNLSPPITSIQAEGTYTIDTYETLTGNPKALKIPRGIDPVSGNQTWLYLEYRQAIDFDSFLSTRSYKLFRGDVTNGVVVHHVEEEDPNSSNLLHLNLDTQFRETYGTSYWFDPALSVGSTYIDTESGVTIRTEWANGTSAGVSVSFGAQTTCTTQTPQVNMSPASQSGDAGATLGYTISLINNDSAACDASTFDVTITSIPDGWSGNLSTRNMSLSPGATGTATLSVTSTDTATTGTYSVQVGISDNSDTKHAKSTTAIYLVNETTLVDDIEAPTTPTGLTASANFKQVSLIWTASSDNDAVSGYQVYRDGIKIAYTVDTIYIDVSGADGVVYEYSVDAYDPSGNVSQKSTPVTAGKSKAKGKGKDSTGGGGNGKGKGNSK